MMNLDAAFLVDDRKTMAKRIAEALRDAIVCLDLKPGDTISESDIAARFGVSRQPVREAFIQLSEAGLVRVRPQRPTEVVKISIRDVLNARFVREALELAVMKKAAAIGPTLPRDHFAAMIDAQVELSHGEDYRAFHALDDAFHREIARLAECEFVWKLIDVQKVQMDRVRFLSLRFNRATTIDEHRGIAAAILAGDAKEVEAQLRLHLGKIDVHIRQIREEYREYFAGGED
ncbi:GntR family transcriptional regulator [Mesorhizobium sp. CAU 1732]|uniref:GntR family transcriptional regulator n=1 Tax=Mesorhizobium sp. CAU 1732 TaxID=3140358 RepID=UPI00325FFF51